MKNRNETLDKLLHQFMNKTQACKVKDDLSFADRLFSEFPAPAIESKALDAIKAATLRKLRHQRLFIITKRLTTIAAVVAIALLAGLSIFRSGNPSPHSDILSSRMENTDISWADMLCAGHLNTDPIKRELTDLTESLHSIGEDAYEPADSFSADQREFEEIELLTKNTDFWKG